MSANEKPEKWPIAMADKKCSEMEEATVRRNYQSYERWYLYVCDAFSIPRVQNAVAWLNWIQAEEKFAEGNKSRYLSSFTWWSYIGWSALTGK